jgi:hypothetical protein
MKVPSANVLRTSRGIWRVDAGGEAGLDGRAVERLRGEQAWQMGDLTGGQQLLEAEVAAEDEGPSASNCRLSWRDAIEQLAEARYLRQGDRARGLWAPGKEHLRRIANGARDMRVWRGAAVLDKPLDEDGDTEELVRLAREQVGTSASRAARLTT